VRAGDRAVGATLRLGGRHPEGERAHVAVVGAAAPTEDAQAEVSVDPPHFVGEAFGVVAFGVVELDELLGA